MSKRKMYFPKSKKKKNLEKVKPNTEIIRLNTLLKNLNFQNNQNYVTSDKIFNKVESKVYAYEVYEGTMFLVNRFLEISAMVLIVYIFIVVLEFLVAHMKGIDIIVIISGGVLLFILATFLLNILRNEMYIEFFVKIVLIIYLLNHLDYFDYDMKLVWAIIIFIAFDFYKLVIFGLYYVILYFLPYIRKNKLYYFHNSFVYTGNKSFWENFKNALKYVNLSLSDSDKYPLKLNLVQGVIVFLLFVGSPYIGLFVGDGNELISFVLWLLGRFLLYLYLIRVRFVNYNLDVMKQTSLINMKELFTVRKVGNYYIVGEYVLEKLNRK